MSVREAAVDLLGKHISSSQDLALVYFDVLATAVRDPGTSVRKRAVNIMWESCIKQPGFPRATQACVHILTRATDPEESIQKLVTKVFHNLWFSPVGQGKSSLPIAICYLLCQMTVLPGLGISVQSSILQLCTQPAIHFCAQYLSLHVHLFGAPSVTTIYCLMALAYHAPGCRIASAYETEHAGQHH